MKRVAVGGGNPVVVCEAPAGRGGLWLDDDTIAFAPTANSPLLRVTAAGGAPVPLTGSPTTSRDIDSHSVSRDASCCITR